MKFKSPKILYFVAGSKPSASDVEIASALGNFVCFRNANYIVKGASLEKCDGVAGAVPEDYAKAYPDAEKVIADIEKERKKVLAEAKKKEKPKPTVKKEPVKKETEKPKSDVEWSPNG